MVSIFCVRLPAAFCIWYQKGVLQNISSMIIRYHFIMPCLPISAGTPKSTVSISFQTIKQRGCLKIELRWPLLFHLQLKSFGFFSKKEFINLLLKVSSFQTFFFRCHKPPKRLLLQDYVQWPAGRTQFQPS